MNEDLPNLHQFRLKRPSRDGSEVRLDGDGEEVVRRAMELAGEEQPGVLHVLRALNEPGRRSATMLRELGVKLDLNTFSRGPEAELERVVLQARIEAGLKRRRYAGPRHLLIAAAGEATGELRAYLESLGVTPKRLRSVMERPREASAGDPTPSPVYLITAILVLQGLACGCISPAFTRTHEDPTAPLSLIRWTLAIWTAGAGLAFGISLVNGRRWAWSGATGFCAVRAASFAVATAWLFRSDGFSALLTLWCTLLYGGVVGDLLKHRRWFGVPDRRAMRTLWRELSWPIATTLVTDVSVLVTWWWFTGSPGAR